MEKVSDKERVRRALIERGRVTPRDFIGDPIDGGKEIWRLAARIDDLKKDGMPIVTVQKRPSAIYEHRPYPLVTVPENEPDWGDVSRYADETAQLSLEDAA